MGYYIQTNVNKGKAQVLIETVGARREPGRFFDPTGKRIGVCIIDNGLFEAAGIAFSSNEADVFNNNDGRGKKWLSLEREQVISLCPEVEHVLLRLE